MKHFLSIMLFVMLCICEIFSDTEIQKKVLTDISGLHDNQLSVYYVENVPFNENDALEKINVLKSQNFSWDQKRSKDNQVVYENNSGQYFTYNPGKSEYRYNNPLIDQLTDDDVKDTSKLSTIAITYLQQLFSSEADDYVIANDEKEYRVLRDDGQVRLRSITFRFVRKLNGRQIRGLTGNIFITLGANCKIMRFEANTPQIKFAEHLKCQIKTSAIEKYLQKHINSDDYKNHQKYGKAVLKTRVWKVTPSYFAKQVGDKICLLPNLSFFAYNTLEGGTEVRREIQLPLDPSCLANVDKNDIINNNLKK